MLVSGYFGKEALVVDRSMNVQNLTAFILRDEGYGTRTAATLEAAIASLDQAPAGMVLIGDVDDVQRAPALVAHLRERNYGRVVLYSISSDYRLEPDDVGVGSGDDQVLLRTAGPLVHQVLDDYEEPS